MLSKAKNKSLVGLDIEAGSIAATEVRANGRVEVTGHGIAPLTAGAFREGEVADPAALAEALRTLFAEHKLAKEVRLGIANQRVAVRSLFLPPLEDARELESAIRFQAQDHIPMPLEQAVLDWAVVGHGSGEDGERRTEVVVVAARRDMVSAQVESLRKAGLRPVGIDLSAFGMIRALAGGAGAPTARKAEAPSYEQPAGSGEAAAPHPEPAKLYCNLGDVVNLAVAKGSTCVFTRISPVGVEGIAQKLSERRGLTLEHARQWLTHVGLERPTEEIEGDPETIAAVREVLFEGATKLADELRLSLQYYGTQDHALPVESVVACGPGTTIPGLVGRLQQELGTAFAVAKPPALNGFDEAATARLTLSYGLALEE